jgi:hypothetical protein
LRWELASNGSWWRLPWLKHWLSSLWKLY